MPIWRNNSLYIPTPFLRVNWFALKHVLFIYYKQCTRGTQEQGDNH